MFFLLLKQKILSFKNSVNAGYVVRRAPFVVLGFGFWALLYLGTLYLLNALRGIEYFGEALSGKFFSLVFFSLAGFLTLSAVITSLSSFYLSKDIPFLLSEPIAIEDVLSIKAFEAILNSSWMVFSFIPPVFIAYGVHYGAPVSYYMAVFFVLLLFMLITTGVGISAAHVLARSFPAERSREALLGAGLILFVAMYFLLKSSIPHDLTSSENILDAFLTLRGGSALLPDHWSSRAVFPMLRHGKADTFYFALLISNAAFFLLLSFLTGKRLYRKNLERIQPSYLKAGSRFLNRVYPGAGAAFFYKDLKVFFRDTAQWSQLLIIAALAAVSYYNFQSVPLDALSSVSPFMKEIMVLLNMMIAGLMLSAVAARFLYTSVSLEGRAYWIVRTSPVSMRAFLWSKFLHNCIPLAVLIVLLVALTNSALRVGGFLMLLSTATALVLCVSVSGLGTGLGAMYPHFDYENVASVSMSIGGMAFMLISFGVVVLTVALEGAAYYFCRIRQGTAGSSVIGDTAMVAACFALALLINALSFYLPMKRGEKMLDALEETK